MKTPLFQIGDLVAVCKLDDPRIVIPKTVVVGVKQLEADGIYECTINGKPGRYRSKKEQCFYFLKDYSSGWVHENYLRKIDDDEYNEVGVDECAMMN